MNKHRFLASFAPDNDGDWGKIQVGDVEYPTFTREFWTARQRQASNIHEISYRACYKPQLPRLFVERLTKPMDLIYDPFAGRGTTLIEAALLGRQIVGNYINPLSKLLTISRLSPQGLESVINRLKDITLNKATDNDFDLSMFFHPDTDREIRSLRAWLIGRKQRGLEDEVDRWIRMVATNRLTGHSVGFFSVYTLPPNQAVTAERQGIINIRRRQTPSYRNVNDLILKKTKQLIKGLTKQDYSNLALSAKSARFFTEDASMTFKIQDESVSLTVTSPPFLDVVQYARDNWMRCWFNNIDAKDVANRLMMFHKTEDWAMVMQKVLKELYRITKPGGYVAFEVGEIRQGSLQLEKIILPAGLTAGFEGLGVLINQQSFSKTAHIWGVRNNKVGTNSNRIIIFRKL